jgi:hypothetical protein
LLKNKTLAVELKLGEFSVNEAWSIFSHTNFSISYF